MEGVDLDELVDRLRSVTGYAAPAKAQTAPAPAAKKIDAASALIAQQALRRHPAIVWLPFSGAEVAKGLLTQLRESSEAATDAASESTVMQLLHFLNEIADELEVERLSCVFADPAAAIAVRKAKLTERLGLEELPSLSQNVESYPSPWNILLTLLSGPLFECDLALSSERHGDASVSAFARGELRVPNATAAVGRSTQLINANVYDTEAWQSLFHAICHFPIASVRAVWQAALYAFPTSGTLATAYLQREIAELSQQRQLAECAEEDDARAVLKATVRVLNAFYRHLPVAFSTELYGLFFDFVADRVQPDTASLDALYRACLRRDVGNAPSSTELWTRYLEWRATTFTDSMRRREWVKRLYLRILQIPLLRLDSVKEAFESFVAVDLRGRFSFEEKIEMEKRFTRAKAEAAEIDHLMSYSMRIAAVPRPYWATGPAHTSRLDTPLQLFLPRPLRTYEDDIGELSMAANCELELWAAWQTLLERVERPLLTGAGSEALHHSRCRNFYLMRACLFPHQLDSWTDLVHFCLRRQPGQREGANSPLAQQALAQAMTFTTSLDLRSTMQLFAAHVEATHFHHPERASSYLKDGLLACRTTLLGMVRSEHSPFIDARIALQQLGEMTTLSVNWMRLGSDRFHVAMVARFVMHNIELLSLTMATVKALLKGGHLAEPSAVLRPFNTFCSEWVLLELVRNRNAAAGLGVLLSWKEHLLMMVKSAMGRGWGMGSCGVDELFLEACTRLAKADPVSCPAELLSGALRELEDEARLSGVVDVAEFAYLAQLRRNGWVSRLEKGGGGALESAPSVVGVVGARALDGGVAPVRYDSVPFSDGTRASAEGDLVRDAVGLDTWQAFQQDAPGGSESPSTAPGDGGQEVAPEESFWPPLHGGGGGRGGGGGGGVHHSSSRPSASFSPHASQGRRGGFSQPWQRRPWEGRGRGFPRGGTGGSFAGPRYPSSTFRVPSGPVAPPVAKRTRTLLADSRPLPLEEGLGSFIARLSGIRKATEAAVRGGVGHHAAAAAGKSGDGEGKENQRIPELGAVEHLIRELPLISQYDPACAGRQPISTNWLLDVLRAQEALKYTPEDTQTL